MQGHCSSANNICYKHMYLPLIFIITPGHPSITTLELFLPTCEKAIMIINVSKAIRVTIIKYHLQRLSRN